MLHPTYMYLEVMMYEHNKRWHNDPVTQLHRIKTKATHTFVIQDGPIMLWQTKYYSIIYWIGVHMICLSFFPGPDRKSCCLHPEGYQLCQRKPKVRMITDLLGGKPETTFTKLLDIVIDDCVKCAIPQYNQTSCRLFQLAPFPLPLNQYTNMSGTERRCFAS